MRNLFVSILYLLPLFTIAQKTDTTFYSKNLEIINSKDSMFFFRVVEFDKYGKLCNKVKKYEKSGKLIWEGFLTSTNPEIKDGLGIYYSKTGYIKDVEFFFQGESIETIVNAKKLYNIDTLLTTQEVIHYLESNIGARLPEQKYIPFILQRLSDNICWASNHSACQSYLYHSILISEEYKNIINRITILRNAGLLFHKFGQYHKAGEILQKAVYLSEKYFGQNHPQYALSLNDLSFLYIYTSEYDKAQEMIGKAMKIFCNNDLDKYDIDYSRALFNLGTLHTDLKKFQTADSLLYLAKNRIEKHSGKNHPDYASAINNIGVLYYQQGQYKKSEQYYLKAIQLRKKIYGPGHYLTGASISNIATLYHEIGRYPEAEKLFNEASDIFFETLGQNHPRYCFNLMVQVNFYADMGNFEKALKLAILAEKISSVVFGENNPEYSNFLNNLATVYVDLKRYEEAIPIFEKVLIIREMVFSQESVEYMIALNNLAFTYNQTGRYQDAEPLYISVSEIFLKILGQDHPYYATVLNNLADLYINLDNFALAEKYYKNALKIREKLLGKQHIGYIESLIRLTNLYSVTEQCEKSIPLIKKAVPEFMDILKNKFTFLSTSEKEKYIDNYHEVIDRLFYSIYKCRETEPKLCGLATDLCLWLKNSILRSSDIIRRNIITCNDTILLAKYDKWIASNRELSQLYSQQPSKRNADTDSIRIRCDEIEKEIVHLSSERDLLIQKDISWQNISNSMEDKDIAVEFIRVKNTSYIKKDSVYYYALIITKKCPYPLFIRLCNEANLINNQIHFNSSTDDNFIAHIDNRNIKPVNLSGTKQKEYILHDLIIKPLLPYLKGKKKLYFSPSGLLHKISFSSIKLPDGGYIFTEFDVYRVVTTNNLCRKNKADNKIKSFNSAILFGGIDFRKFQSTDNTFNYLNGSKVEVELLYTMLEQEGTKVKIFTGAHADEKNFKTNANKADLIHLATHGFSFPNPDLHLVYHDKKGLDNDKNYQKSNPLKLYMYNEEPLQRSGVIFACAIDSVKKENPVENTEDGVLTAFEALQLDLRNTQLAVLSACQTGLGDIRGYEGAYGLQRAFRIAGAQNIIVSLWNIPDIETQEFMSLFYKYLLRSYNIHDSFIKAQKKMQKKYNNPFFWGGFILIE